MVATGGLLLCSVAIYSGGHAAALTFPARDPVTDDDMERLAQSVAEHLMAADFVEPAGDRLRLSIRGDLLFVKGVVNRRSARRVHKALLTAPDVGVVVLNYVPGSAHDPTNLEWSLGSAPPVPLVSWCDDRRQLFRHERFSSKLSGDG